MALTKEDLQAIQALLEPINNRLDTMQADISGLKQGQADLIESQQNIRTSQLKVELEQYPRIAAALDGVVGGIEKNKDQDSRISVLENKADNHSTRIWALEQAKAQ